MATRSWSLVFLPGVFFIIRRPLPFTSDHSLMLARIRKGCFLTMQWFLRPLNTLRREECYDQIAERKCGCNNFESFRLLFPDVVTHLCLKFSDKRRFFQINAVQGGDKLCHFENICSHLPSIAISVLFHSQRNKDTVYCANDGRGHLF